jgi:hypothetical protein
MIGNRTSCEPTTQADASSTITGELTLCTFRIISLYDITLKIYIERFHHMNKKILL